MKTVRIFTIDSGVSEFQMPDNFDALVCMRNILADRLFAAISTTGESVLIPLHAIKMMTAIQGETHPGTERKQ